MGIIARRLEEVRNDSGWLTREDGDDPLGTLTSSGISVSERTALSLTTIWRVWDLLASAVAQAPKDIIVKVGPNSFPEYGTPSWMVMPNPADPTFTVNDYFAAVALSLLSDGNYFVGVYPHIYDPQQLIPIPPSLVEPKGSGVYDIKDPKTGQVVRTLTWRQMLHGRWFPFTGRLRSPSPLGSLGRTLGAAIAAEDYASRFFGQGAALSFGVEVPYPMDPTKLQNLRESLKSKYVGLRNSHAIGVLSDGGKFVTGLAPSPEQSQMLQTRKFSVEDLCRVYGVPPAMVGSTEPGAASFASTENYDKWFKERAVVPLAERIEDQHNRLVQVPASVTDPRASAQFKFNLDGIVRGSLLERAQAQEIYVRSGIKTPDEARSDEDMGPKAGGDQLYMQQQMVPIGLLGQTKLTEPLNTQAPAGDMPAAGMMTGGKAA